MNTQVSALSQPRDRLEGKASVITRGTWALAMGFLCGLFWQVTVGGDAVVTQMTLLPDSNLPRYLRFLAPCTLIFCCQPRWVSLTSMARIPPLVALVFVAIPVGCTAYFGQWAFVQDIALPFVAAGLLVQVALALPRWVVRRFLVGVGLSCLVLLLYQLNIRGGLATVTFLRSRLVLGLGHPIMAYSAVLVSFLAVVMACRLWAQARSRWITAATILCGWLALAWALSLVGSRTAQLGVLAAGGFYGLSVWLHGVRRKRRLWGGLAVAITGIALLGLACYAVYYVDLVGGSHKYSRLAQYHQVLADLPAMIKNGQVFAPTPFVVQRFAEVGPSYLVVDSLFFSYAGVFGVAGFVVLMIWWLRLGGRLATAGRHLPLAVWLTLTVIYSFDGQGFTPSNGALFAALVWVISESYGRSFACDCRAEGVAPKLGRQGANTVNRELMV